jgi:hypothetical protein
MRRLILLASPLLLTAACTPFPFLHGTEVRGTADYVLSSSATTGSSGALPTDVLYCSIDGRTPGVPPRVEVRVGGPAGCVLELNRADQSCDLPTEHGPLHLHVTSVSTWLALHYVPARYVHGVTTLPLNVVVGGEADDGRHLTFRFTGSEGVTGGDEACDALDRTLHPRPPVSSEVPEASWSSWGGNR